MAKRPHLPLTIRTTYFFIRLTTDISLRRDGTVNRRLVNFLEKTVSGVPSSIKPRRGVKTIDVTVDASRNLWVRLFIPTEVNSEAVQDSRIPVVVFFHGGGFVYLSADCKQYDSVCRRFAREIHAVIISVNYRLAPEHRYPSQYDDGFDVLKFLDQNSHVLPGNADLSRCFLAGDSSGANIAHHVAKRCCESPKFSRVEIIGVVAIQPFFGGKEPSKSEIELEKIDVIVSFKRTNWFWKAFLPVGTEVDLDHESINVSGPKASDISKLDLPATMVVIGGFDSFKDWQRKYYQWLKDSGKEAYLIEYPDMVHGFYLFPHFEESTQLIHEIKNFMHKQCSDGEHS